MNQDPNYERLMNKLTEVVEELQGIDERIEWLCDKMYPPKPVEGTITAAIESHAQIEREKADRVFGKQTRTDTSHLDKQKSDADRFKRDGPSIPAECTCIQSMQGCKVHDPQYHCRHTWITPTGQNKNQASHYSYRRVCTKCGKEERWLR